MRLRALAVAALLAGLVVPAAASAQNQRFWGVHAFEEPSAEDFRMMQRGGIGIVRIGANWRRVEPDAPVGGVRQYRWAQLDRIVAAAAPTKVRIHFGFSGVPSWIDRDIQTSPMVSAAGRQGWRDFVRATIERYGHDGHFWRENPGLTPKPVRSVQIWNEQNSGSRYKPRPDPEEYADLLRLSAAPIRAIDPRIRILPGGMFGTPQSPDGGSIPAWTFMRRLYAERGASGLFDGVAVHPYGVNIREIDYQLRRMRKVIRRHGDPRTRMHVTEIGWSSGRGEGVFYKGPKGQRRMLARSFKHLLGVRRKLRLGSIFWHGWKDLAQPIAGCGACSRMGLVRTDLTPKASYNTYRRLARR
jgi:hypothetical protein